MSLEVGCEIFKIHAISSWLPLLLESSLRCGLPQIPALISMSPLCNQLLHHIKRK